MCAVLHFFFLFTRPKCESLLLTLTPFYAYSLSSLSFIHWSGITTKRQKPGEFTWTTGNDSAATAYTANELLLSIPVVFVIYEVDRLVTPLDIKGGCGDGNDILQARLLWLSNTQEFGNRWLIEVRTFGVTCIFKELSHC